MHADGEQKEGIRKVMPLGIMMGASVPRCSPGFRLVYKGASEAGLTQKQAYQMTDAQLVSDDVNVLLTGSSGAGRAQNAACADQ